MKPLIRFIPCIVAIDILCGCQSPQQSAVRSATVVDNISSNRVVHGAVSFGTYSIPEPLVSLNDLFLQGYQERQAFVKSNTSPVIVANFGALILSWNGITETNRCIPDIYHALKAVAHLPFGIFVRLDSYATESSGKLPDQVIQELKKYPARIAAAEASLSEAGFSPIQLERQKAILSRCQECLDSVFATGTISRQELLALAKQVRPWLLKNADDAAAAQLELTHSVVMEWRRRMPPEQWKNLTVVVRGPQMPRRLNLLTQYFARVLHEKGHHLGYPMESRHLIYAESISGSRDYLDLMATTLIDGAASEAFFGDRWRMSRDLLADGAAKQLKRMSFD